MAALLAKQSEEIYVIYALDPARKDIDEYIRTAKILLDGLNVVSTDVIEIDSVRFWGGERNNLLPAARQALAPLLERHAKDTVYFGNCLTNPVALALKRYAQVNHLYHAPSDFNNMLVPKKNPLKSFLKDALNLILNRSFYKIEIGDLPIYTLLNFDKKKKFQYLNFNDFSSMAVEAALVELSRELNVMNVNIMLLLAGDEPGVGDNNHSNIAKYLLPHLEAVDVLMKEHGLKEATLWLKEHRSYLPLVLAERELLADRFSSLGCSVRFVSDYLPKEYRLLPGECILKYCRYDHIIAEPSSFLLNVVGSINAVYAVSSFAPYRDIDQIGRNNEFLKINELVAKPCRVN